MSKLDLTKPIRRKSDGAKAVVLDDFRAAVRNPHAAYGWDVELIDANNPKGSRFENVPERVTVEERVCLERDGHVRLGVQASNCRFTFEGDVLVDAEVIK